MIDDSNYLAEETLRDGRAVIVRAIRASDKQAMLDAFHGLEAQTIYMRLFAAQGEPTEKTLREWTEIDFSKLMRLVVCLPRPDGSEQIIGGASFAMLEPGNPAAGAEISFTLEEDFQGQGLGGKLLAHLARIARERGITRFVAETLSENRAMLAVFGRSGFPMTHRREQGVIHVELDIGD
ncbi:MAG: GNAT family N-acetyltransferase [Rhizobacter sp.]|nr:GNAT family N-acetyltransferase [Burkholderiaceae bacterium]MCO5123039.1 GNAT family N-acetyltransferase [Rhizobacter sp.]